MTATRILKGQLDGHLGPETPLAMDRFPYMALSKVSLEALQEVARAGTAGWEDYRPGAVGKSPRKRQGKSLSVELN